MVDNRRQLDAVLAKAREKDVFLMEGMWTRCFPAVRQARSWIAEGKIGKPLTVKSGFDIKPDVSDWQPWKGGISHAGGALRDVGIYALAMAQMVFPESPKAVSYTHLDVYKRQGYNCRILCAGWYIRKRLPGKDRT